MGIFEVRIQRYNEELHVFKLKSGNAELVDFVFPPQIKHRESCGKEIIHLLRLYFFMYYLKKFLSLS